MIATDPESREDAQTTEGLGSSYVHTYVSGTLSQSIVYHPSELKSSGGRGGRRVTTSVPVTTKQTTSIRIRM